MHFGFYVVGFGIGFGHWGLQIGVLTLAAVLKLITPLLSSSWSSSCLDVLVVGRLDAHLVGLLMVVFMIFLMLLLLVVFMVFSMIFVGSNDGLVVGCIVALVF